MTLIDRVRGLFSRYKTIATMLPAWESMRPSYPEVNYETMVKSGWRKNELIYACIEKKAKTASQVALKVYRKADDAELPDHPLQTLLDHPNNQMGQSAFWASIIRTNQLSPDAYYEKVRSRAGRVVQLLPLRPDWMSPIKSNQGIAGYEYRVPGVSPIQLKKEDVLHFPGYDPINNYNGWPPVAVAARIGDVDNSTTDFIKLFWENGAIPMGILTSEQVLTDKLVEDIQRRWSERYGGYKRWLEPAVLSKGATYQRTGMTFTEMGFEALDKRDEIRICQVFDIPPIIVGAGVGMESSTYNNLENLQKDWWRNSLMPMYEEIDDVINFSLVPEFGEDIYVAWDFSDVYALQEDEGAKWTRSKEALASGAITVNEYREMIGLDRLPGATGDIFLRSMAQIEVPISGRVEEPEPEPEPEPQEEDDRKHYHQHREIKVNDPDEKERMKHERIILQAMEDHLGKQLNRIIKEVGSD